MTIVSSGFAPTQESSALEKPTSVPGSLVGAIEVPGTHPMGLGLSDMAAYSDLMRIDAIWNRLCAVSVMNGGRGGLVCAPGAFDMALHATWHTLLDWTRRESTTL